MSGDATATALFAFGYPVSIAVILRFVPVVRERRLKWLVAATVWYALGGRSTARRGS